jgi:peptidoglycan/xylan/chitin deacetylase (PgdA/CDA1 family)
VKLALKIDVDTFRGTREGVPALLAMLERHGAGATFLFSLGPDHTGRAIKRALRPGFMNKVGRTSVVSHYGVRTLLYGTLLPGPDIGRKCADVMRDVRNRGFEVGIHTWDHVRWQDGVASAGEDWTHWQMALAVPAVQGSLRRRAPRARRGGLADELPRLSPHADAGLSLLLGYARHASLHPVIRAEIVGCPQFPTTLPRWTK